MNRECSPAHGYFARIRTEIMPFIPPHYKKVLEVGCGEGTFRSNLRVDAEYWGIEPVPRVAKYARQKLNKVLLGTYQEVADELPDEYFDLVICNDVIEHMVDHDWFLRSIKRKMKADAVLVGSVPNVRHYSLLKELLLKKDWKYKQEGILDGTHLRFFTEKSLRRSFIRHGFAIEILHGINGVFQSQSKTLKSLLRNALLTLLILGTGGYYGDVQYLQFGFRVKSVPSNPSLDSHVSTSLNKGNCQVFVKS